MRELTKDGSFTVKSAYFLALKNSNRSLFNQRMENEGFLDKVMVVEYPPKLAMFIWKLHWSIEPFR